MTQLEHHLVNQPLRASNQQQITLMYWRVQQASIQLGGNLAAIHVLQESLAPTTSPLELLVVRLAS